MHAFRVSRYATTRTPERIATLIQVSYNPTYARTPTYLPTSLFPPFRPSACRLSCYFAMLLSSFCLLFPLLPFRFFLLCLVSLSAPAFLSLHMSRPSFSLLPPRKHLFLQSSGFVFTPLSPSDKSGPLFRLPCFSASLHSPFPIPFFFSLCFL